MQHQLVPTSAFHRLSFTKSLPRSLSSPSLQLRILLSAFIFFASLCPLQRGTVSLIQNGRLTHRVAPARLAISAITIILTIATHIHISSTTSSTTIIVTIIISFAQLITLLHLYRPAPLRLLPARRCRHRFTH